MCVCMYHSSVHLCHVPYSINAVIVVVAAAAIFFVFFVVFYTGCTNMSEACWDEPASIPGQANETLVPLAVLPAALLVCGKRE